MRRLFAVVAIAATSLAIGVGASSSPAAAGLPAGFTDTPIPISASNPLASPTTIVSLPGGRAMVLEKAGAVRIVENDVLSFQDSISLPVCSGSEMGLLGAAVDPEFLSNSYIYLFYTHSTGNCGSASGRANRVSRFTMSANVVVPTSEVVLLDNISATGGNHNGGALQVGQDGYLYVAIGDAGSNPRGAAGSSAQDLSLLNGKILRITTAGTAAPGNPFVGDSNAISCATAGLAAPTSGKCTEIYSWGLRNPYRFAFDPNTGSTRFFINDVGQNTWEEVDEGGIGRNYGWNAREGACVNGSTTNCPAAPAGITDPLTAYSHSIGCTFITAGAFVPDGIWPKAFDGSYLFADGGCDKIWQRTAAGAVDYNNPLHTVSGGIVDMAFVTSGADPALYYVTVQNSMIRKLSYDAPAAITSTGLAYSPLASATRAYDTRNDIGVGSGTVRANTTRLVDLGIDDPSVKAALVNITMDGPLGPSYVVASQPRTERVATSNVNAAPGDIVANASIVPVDADGNVLIYVFGTTHVIVDVMGVFTQTPVSQPGGRFSPLSPARLIDTREPAGATNTFSLTGETVTAPVAGRGAVPSSVTAVALIVTGIADASAIKGYVSVYPSGGAVPPSSSLNVNGLNDIRPNLVVVPLGADGSINLRLFATPFVVVDVAGYFVSGATVAGMYHLTAPTRQVDSRNPLGFARLADNATGTLDPGGAVPASATAISQNVTMTASIGGGFVTSYPAGQTLPLASNGNTSGIDQSRASLTLTKIGTSGVVNYYVSSSVDLVVDVTGYFD
ncbi:MAG: PQQ-dependent sugar dehydrogenase [Ilumatobacteraceae bacterium]